MNYLIDTNIIIDYLRHYKPTKEFLLNLLSNRNNLIYISVMSNLELHTGQSIQDASSIKLIQNLFDLVDIVNVDLEVSSIAGDLSRQYQMEVIDAVLAATALENDFTLVTRNRKHFTKIQDLKILTP